MIYQPISFFNCLSNLEASTFQHETSLDMTVSDLSRLYLLQLDPLGNNLVLDAANITLELPGGNALVKHLLDLGVVTALHLGETVVEVDTHRDGEGEEDEANLVMLVGCRVFWDIGDHLLLPPRLS